MFDQLASQPGHELSDLGPTAGTGVFEQVTQLRAKRCAAMTRRTTSRS